MPLKKYLATKTKSIFQKYGVDIAFHSAEPNYPPDFSQRIIEICEAVKPYTMTSPERVNALIDAVNYIVKHEIDGAFVECGVWKGGSAMAMALELNYLGDHSRNFYLYDTYSGMSAPTKADISLSGGSAIGKFSKTKLTENSSDWCFSPLAEVATNVHSTQYPKEKIHFIEGKVEDTIPANLPEKIALLRLDTDWYESTKHEMIHLFPRLVKGGVLIIDDYGHWQGAKKAIDEYFAENAVNIFLNRIDYTGRIALKL